MAPNRYPQSVDTPTVQQWLGQAGGCSNVYQPADAALTRPNNTTAYANHNAIGSTTTALFKFSNFFRMKGSSGQLRSARLIANVASVATGNMGAIRMHLFNASPLAQSGLFNGAGSGTVLIDQGVFMSLFADEAGKQGWIDFATWSIGGTNSDTIESFGVINTVALEQNPHPVIAAPGAQDLYAILEATGAFTPAALQVILPYLSASLD